MVSLKISVLVIACTLIASSAANPFELHARVLTPCKTGTHREGKTCADNDTDAHCGNRNDKCVDPENGSETCDRVNKNAPYKCTITCDKGYFQKGSLCAQNSVPAHCGLADTDCADPANGKATCIKSGAKNFKCSFTCNSGFSKVGNRCDANDSADNCGSEGACEDPDHGTAICTGSVKKGFSCGAKCDRAYTLNDDDACEANNNTVKKCGPTNDVCAGPYGGHGAAICDNGDCDVKCSPGFKKRVAGGVVYCK